MRGVATGWREENASKTRDRDSVSIQIETEMALT
jgi:hypothetical protein